MSGSTSRRAFLGTGLALLAGIGAVSCARREEEKPTLPEPVLTENYLVYRDLQYAAPVGRGHLLDLYVPLDAAGPVPVIIHQLGSAFKSDDTKGNPVPDTTPGPQNDAATTNSTARPPTPARPPDPASLSGMIAAPGLAAIWVPRGYAVVGLNVRNSSQVKFPGQVHDVKAAIRYLRAIADTCGLDSDRFATMGSSSGGWVAAMAALTSGIDALEGGLGHPSYSSSVQAVIDLYGPTNFLTMDAHALPGGESHDAASSPESQLMGFAIQTDRDAVEKANPATYVRADSPPAFIMHGTSDPFVPFNQSEILFDAYVEAGATASLTLVPGVGHTDAYLSSPDLSAGRTVIRTSGGDTTRGDEPAPTYDTLLAFLDTHLGT